eukprot:NODE_15448_length_1049_cov_8.272234.p1 GENE.NODE_15448_length_1049_cov_8.272234~~NODE_15448_length_1049_cov_8.272234.p1  ORF type:complete len:252 (-),score=49.97 NODE_15448_length_1049_cov_8.272234:184-939(-)
MQVRKTAPAPTATAELGKEASMVHAVTRGGDNANRVIRNVLSLEVAPSSVDGAVVRAEAETWSLEAPTLSAGTNAGGWDVAASQQERIATLSHTGTCSQPPDAGTPAQREKKDEEYRKDDSSVALLPSDMWCRSNACMATVDTAFGPRVMGSGLLCSSIAAPEQPNVTVTVTDGALTPGSFGMYDIIEEATVAAPAAGCVDPAVTMTHGTIELARRGSYGVSDIVESVDFAEAAAEYVTRRDPSSRVVLIL